MKFDIEHISNQCEGVQLEAKSAKGGLPDSLWETYSAFANTDGGTILLGVEENRDHHFTIIGLPDAEKMKVDFWNMINNRQKISHNILTNQMVYTQQAEGKTILVIEVPRAERTVRPVFKGLDPRTGTYRRWNEGDHLCTLEEVGAMLRDAALTTQDAKVLKGMTSEVFCADTVRAYHQYFISANPGHPWSKLPDELFLRRIGAIGMADDGCYYPTSAGLLMFGYEYEIVREFPQYFLDYQEDRNLLGTTRWTDRVVSSSGEWSGNLFDFVFKILPKLQNGLKIPFVLRGNQRIDDTPLHKLLREATVNTLSHADFYGRQGIVIAKDSKGFEFSNPGDLRISRQEAIDGGVSDPRNGVILKMFSLIRFGERAGSGLSSIFYVWQKVFHTHATLVQKESSAIRTVLTLPYDGHEQDVEAMLELYPDDITVDKTVDKPSINLKTVDKPSIKRETVDKPSIKTMIAERYSASHQISSLADQTIENMVIILKYLQKAPSATADDIIGLLGKSRSRVKEYMRTLLSLNLIQAHGANRTRSYTLASEIHI